MKNSLKLLMLLIFLINSSFAKNLYIFVVNGDGPQAYFGHPNGDKTKKEVLTQSDENAVSEAKKFLQECGQCDGVIYHFNYKNSGNDSQITFLRGVSVNQTISKGLPFSPDFHSSIDTTSYEEKHFIWASHIESTVDHTASFLNNMTKELFKFDSINLFTPHGGRIDIITSLASFSDFTIAAPGVIHASYFDASVLKDLEQNHISVREKLDNFQKKIFEYNKDTSKVLETSIALYDNSVIREYDRSRVENIDFPENGDEVDCNDYEYFRELTGELPDVQVLFQKQTPFVKLLATKFEEVDGEMLPVQKLDHSGFTCYLNI